MTKTLYVPSRGQAIPMPGHRPDWPLDGQPINEIDAYQRRLVRDGDLVIKPDDLPKPRDIAPPPQVEDPPPVVDRDIDPAKLTAGKITASARKAAKGGE